MLKAIFFDAAGTLIHLPRSVGEHYRDVAVDFGVILDAKELDATFKTVWKEAPDRSASRGAWQDDGKGWWRGLVSKVLAQTLSQAQAASFDEPGYFEAVYTHFAKPGVWTTYPDAYSALETLRARGLRLGLISNFDRRLYPILDELKLSGFFDAIIISSEVGADKPNPLIFEVALTRLQVKPNEAMHVGDDPKKDGGAEAAGLEVFRLERPTHDLHAVVAVLDNRETQGRGLASDTGRM